MLLDGNKHQFFVSGQQLDEMKQNMEVKFRNLSLEMNSVMGQLTQDGKRDLQWWRMITFWEKGYVYPHCECSPSSDSRIMQKLSSMKKSMIDLSGKWREAKGQRF